MTNKKLYPWSKKNSNDSSTEINLGFSKNFLLKDPLDLEQVENSLEFDHGTNLEKRITSFRGQDSFIKVCLNNLVNYELGTEISLTGRNLSKSVGSEIAVNKTLLF